jgi:DNA-3-methyladenine glycosylase II
MWYVKSNEKPDWSMARRDLMRADPVLVPIIKHVGKCTIVPRRDYFNLLCISIFNQQISMKIAAILYGRFRDLFPRRRPTPQRLLDMMRRDIDCLKGCGVSRQKRSYLLDLSEKFVQRKIPVHRLWHMTDEEVMESLTQVKGIGRWSAEMFLMFVLNRPDVLPVDDLGLQEAVKRAYKLHERPDKKKLTEMGERWRPWRSIATWYLWRGMEDKQLPKPAARASKSPPRRSRAARQPARSRHPAKSPA